MQRDVIEEFYRELEATDETYVRKRFRTAGYAGWKCKHVKQWLDGRENARAERRAASMTRWTMIGAVSAICTVIVAIIALWRK